MKERSVIFSGAMVRAILDGKKKQMRRIIKEQPTPDEIAEEIKYADGYALYGREYRRSFVRCPYGEVGDRLWVREAWAPIPSGPCAPGNPVMYRATVEKPNIWSWKPSIHMPRWASRITLDVTAVRVERLNDISGQDAVAEGTEYAIAKGETMEAQLAFRCLWESINGPGSWDQNPWVWVIEFQRVEEDK